MGKARVPFLHYADARFASLENEISERARLLQEEIDRRMEAQNRAIDKAQGEMNRRLEGMNEFRDAMRDQAGQMLTKDAFTASITAEKDRADIVHESLEKRLEVLERRDASRAGSEQGASGERTERRLNAGQMLVLAGLIVALAGLAVTIIIATRH